MDKTRIAIIGASTGQYPLCLKAKELGYETYCFAWSKGAICKDIVDHFLDISITETERIAQICKAENIKCVLSNGSDFPSEQAAAINEILGFPTTPYKQLLANRNKDYIRNKCRGIIGLKQIRHYIYEGEDENIYPCVVKPIVGGGKIGISFAKDKSELEQAIQYARSSSDEKIVIEEYIEGKELSVESISYQGQHTVVQITQKDSSSAPHFVELGHHQPASITNNLRQKIESVVPQILDAIGFMYGPTHIELKYNENDEIYLIEANLRGGGDMISNKLVELSTGFDYLKSMIDVAIGNFQGVKYGNQHFAGIYYLCSQTKDYLDFFKNSDGQPWLVEKEIYSEELKESLSNYERNGYLIYCSDKKIKPCK